MSEFRNNLGNAKLATLKMKKVITTRLRTYPLLSTSRHAENDCGEVRTHSLEWHRSTERELFEVQSIMLCGDKSQATKA